MDAFEQVVDQLPGPIKNVLNKIPANIKKETEEIRFRINRPICLNLREGEAFLNQKGICKAPQKAFLSKHKDIQNIIQILSKNSLYAFQEELKQGYITITGGHRVGFVGKTLIEDGKILNQRNISGINFRISREIIGAGDLVAPKIFNSKTGRIENTLIVSPPGAGKTTLLRDLARIFSDGDQGGSPCKVSLIDERSEIAGSYIGVPQKNVGIRTDVLDGSPKAQGIMLVIRSMSPDLIVTDEIGKDEDVFSIKEAINSGVKVLVSAHSDSIEALMLKRGFRDLFQIQGFKHVIILSRKNGPGTIESTYCGKDFIYMNKKRRNII